jgi:hypothetical protein
MCGNWSKVHYFLIEVGSKLYSGGGNAEQRVTSPNVRAVFR